MTRHCYGISVLVLRYHFLGEVYMRKLALASFIPQWLLDFVSCLHDWVTSYRVCMKVHFMLIKYTCHSDWQILRMCYPFQSTGRLISHQQSHHFAFTCYRYNIAYWSEILTLVELGWTHLGVTCTGWHFVVVSCKQIQSHERELEWTHAGAKVAPASC